MRLLLLATILLALCSCGRATISYSKWEAEIDGKLYKDCLISFVESSEGEYLEISCPGQKITFDIRKINTINLRRIKK